MDRHFKHQLAIAAAGVIVLLTSLGTSSLWDRDEPRNARCAAEMLERGDWVVPYFNDEIRTHKPVLLYWLMMAATLVFGPGELAARFPSALLGLGTALATYHIGRRLFCARVGLWSALILVTSLNFAVAARAATPDSTLIFFCTLAILFWVLGVFPKTNGPDAAHTPSFVPARTVYFVLTYAAMGMGVLAKGPVGVVMPTAVIGLFLLYATMSAGRPTTGSAGGDASRLGQTGRWLGGQLKHFAPRQIISRGWSMRPVTLLAVVVAVAGPWYLAVGLRTGGVWTEEFFFKHNLQRATGAMESHSGPVVYYLGAMLVGFFPWSIFAVPTLINWLRRAQEQRPWQAGYLLIACWAAVYVVVFSLVQTKLPSYVLPAYPALALATGLFVHRWTLGTADVSRWWLRIGFGCLAIVGLGMLIGLPLAADRYLPGEAILGIIGLVPLVSAITCWLLSETRRPRAAATAMVFGSIALAVSIFGFAMPRVDHHKMSRRLIEQINRHGGPNAQIAAYIHLEPSVVYYAGRPIPIYYEQEKIARILRDPDGYAVIQDTNFAELRGSIPKDVEVLARLPRFLKKGEVLVLGRSRHIRR